MAGVGGVVEGLKVLIMAPCELPKAINSLLNVAGKHINELVRVGAKLVCGPMERTDGTEAIGLWILWLGGAPVLELGVVALDPPFRLADERPSVGGDLVVQ